MNNAIYSDIFAALGNESRLAILLLLLRHLPGELAVGDIQKHTGIANSTLSHHLDRLRREKLVEARKEKQWIWYRVNAQTLQSVADFLGRNCCRGTSDQESDSQGRMP